MANITAQNIVNKAEIILQDTTNTRWPEDELLGWLNDGQREIVLHKPDANPTNVAIQLNMGTKQCIPSDGMQLIEVIRNMGTDGNTPGRAIRLISRTVLDEQRPNWHTEQNVDEVKHYIFDERDPKRFYVYPPISDAGPYVETVYSSAPIDIGVDDAISIDDIYANAMLDYIIYRAYLKDADYTANNQRVQSMYEIFLNSIGRLEQREVKDNPYLRDKLGAAVSTGGGQ